MDNKIHVMVKEPGEKWERREVDNTLRAFQGLVGGYIETVTVTPGRLFLTAANEPDITLQRQCILYEGQPLPFEFLLQLRRFVLLRQYGRADAVGSVRLQFKQIRGYVAGA